MNKLVTRDSMRDLINNPNKKFVANVIGRALVILFKNQTADEQATNDTKEENGIGFTGADAHSGSITAKYFIKHGTLLDWQIERWSKLAASGYPRIAKYHAQLNVAANQRRGNNT